MKTNVLLLVSIPSLHELAEMKLSLGYDANMRLLETYALLQQSLTGQWEIDEDGFAQKKIIDPSVWTSTGQTVWIDLASIDPIEIMQIRVHYQRVQKLDENIIIGKPVQVFEIVDKYPCEVPFSKFAISAMKIKGKLISTYRFDSLIMT